MRPGARQPASLGVTTTRMAMVSEVRVESVYPAHLPAPGLPQCLGITPAQASASWEMWPRPALVRPVSLGVTNVTMGPVSGVRERLASRATALPLAAKEGLKDRREALPVFAGLARADRGSSAWAASAVFSGEPACS